MPGSQVTATQLLQPWLAAQYGALASALLRLDEPDQVHRARVRIRRLRSILAAYEVAIPRTGLKAELRSLGGVIGALRDVDVLIARLSAATDSDARAAWLDTLESARRTALETAQEYVAGYHVQRLQEHLHDVSTRTPWAHLPPAPASTLVAEVLDRELAAVRRLAQSADSVEDLHNVRKAAKKVRYVAELGAAEHVLAEQVGRQAKAVQDELGAYLDDLLLADWLEAWASNPENSGHREFTLRYASDLRADAADRQARLHQAVAGLGEG